eukprot:ctg_1834.g471
MATQEAEPSFSLLPHAAVAAVDASIEEKLRLQIEFYLSDSNLPRDKFLRARVEADPEGYVDLALLNTFKRMQVLHSDVQAIARALQSSDLVELSADRLRVRRRRPLPAEDTSKRRSVYVKGFPPGDPQSCEPQLEQVARFFSQFGRVVSVRMRRKRVRGAVRGTTPSEASDEEGEEDGKPRNEVSAGGNGATLSTSPERSPSRLIFKGSVFVELDSEDAVQRLLERHAREPLQWPEASAPFLIESKAAYYKRKHDESKQVKRTRKQAKQRATPKSDTKAETPSRKRLAADVELLRADAPAVSAPETGSSSSSSDDNDDDNESVDESEGERTYEPGLVLHMDGIGASCDREEVRESLSKFGELGWVDYLRGDSSGHARFVQSGAAATAASASLELGGQTAALRVLQGDEERAYWQKLWEAQDAIRTAERRKKQRADKAKKVREKMRKYGRRKVRRT